MCFFYITVFMNVDIYIANRWFELVDQYIVCEKTSIYDVSDIMA